MVLGKYKVKNSHLNEFNSRYSDYGKDLKDIVFDFKSKKINNDKVTYRIEFAKEDLTFQDAITKDVSQENQSWFENFFEKLN